MPILRPCPSKNPALALDHPLVVLWFVVFLLILHACPQTHCRSHRFPAPKLQLSPSRSGYSCSLLDFCSCNKPVEIPQPTGGQCASVDRWRGPCYLIHVFAWLLGVSPSRRVLISTRSTIQTTIIAAYSLFLASLDCAHFNRHLLNLCTLCLSG